MRINIPLFSLGFTSPPAVTHLTSHRALLLLDRTIPHSSEPEEENTGIDWKGSRKICIAYL